MGGDVVAQQAVGEKAGNDFLFGNAGDDTLRGGEGIDDLQEFDYQQFINALFD